MDKTIKLVFLDSEKDIKIEDFEEFLFIDFDLGKRTYRFRFSSDEQGIIAQAFKNEDYGRMTLYLIDRHSIAIQ